MQFILSKQKSMCKHTIHISQEFEFCHRSKKFIGGQYYAL